MLGQFHREIMESRKQLRVVATSINKPMEFCLWYYYHAYKPAATETPSYYKSLKKMMAGLKQHENADECLICEEGGELLCCETCPESYHLECLGLEQSDVDGVEKWSCPTCIRKRNLQLSPPKSPSKRRRMGTDGSPGAQVAGSSQSGQPRALDMSTEGMSADNE